MNQTVQFNYQSVVAIAFVVLLIFCSTANTEELKGDPDTLPMYGQPARPRSEAEKKSDEAVIRDNTLRFKTRAAGAVAFAGQAWSALRAKQFDLAMQRFNQSWLMNPKYYGA